MVVTATNPSRSRIGRLDSATGCIRYEAAEALRVGGTLFGESIDPAVVSGPYRLVKLRYPGEVARLAQLSDAHSLRQARLACNHLYAADDYGLLVFGLKAGRAQAVGQVGRAIVPVQLLLERLAAGREDLHLPRDQRVEFLPVEAGEVAVPRRSRGCRSRASRTSGPSRSTRTDSGSRSCTCPRSCAS